MKIKIEKVKIISLLSLFLFPELSLAAGGLTLKTAAGYILTNFILPIPKLLVALGLCYFFYGLFVYLYDFSVYGINEKKMIEGRQIMIYGLLGLTVMFSVWGLVDLVGTSLGLW